MGVKKGGGGTRPRACVDSHNLTPHPPTLPPITDYAYSRGKHAEWAKWDREWAQHKVSKKKEMAAWLESQPYDDEVLAAAAATEKE